MVKIIIPDSLITHRKALQCGDKDKKGEAKNPINDKGVQ